MAQSFSRQLYVSKAWRELRFNLIIERGPICQQCSKVMIDTSKLVGHHKIALSLLRISLILMSRLTKTTLSSRVFLAIMLPTSVMDTINTSY